MYWTQTGDNARIGTAWMDGSKPRTIAQEILEPTGLAIDYSRNDSVYFCDRKHNKIEVMNWDGSGRKSVYQGEREFFFLFRTSLFPSLSLYRICLMKEGLRDLSP